MSFNFNDPSARVRFTSTGYRAAAFRLNLEGTYSLFVASAFRRKRPTGRDRLNGKPRRPKPAFPPP
jgi:hypothetical protein